MSSQKSDIDTFFITQLYEYRFHFLAASCGFISHAIYFIHGEHHQKGTFILGALALAWIGSTTFFLGTQEFGRALYTSTQIVSTYVLFLWISMIVYRLLFHPLRAFNGPKLARATKLYHTWLIRGGKNYREIAKVHEHYGDIVRIGSRSFYLTCTRPYVCELYQI